MTVACEFIDVIIPIRNIERAYPGGFIEYCEDFRADFGGRLWHDGVILHDGAMGPVGVRMIIEEWSAVGLVPMETDGQRTIWKDLCVVESLFGGPTLECEWLRMHPEVRGVYHVGHESAPAVSRVVMERLLHGVTSGEEIANLFRGWRHNPMSRHFRRMEHLGDWQLLHPERHWKPGYSAQRLAKSWHQAGSTFPPMVQAALDGAEDPRLHGLELVAAFGEFKTALPGGSRPSHTDLLVLARSATSLVVIGVEGKCQEAFGPTIAEWDRSDVRLDYLQGLLPGAKAFDPGIRYQLLHRSASAAIEAERFHAPIAVMLVHQFGGECESWGDYRTFLATFGVEARRGTVQQLGVCGNGVELCAGWVGE